MVRGLNIFREYFGDFTDSYIIIGGTACNQQFESLGLTFRATTDIDIVLVIDGKADTIDQLKPKMIDHARMFIMNYLNWSI